VCLFSFVCKNKQQLFAIEKDEFFVCDFDSDAFDEMQTLLTQPPE